MTPPSRNQLPLEVSPNHPLGPHTELIDELRTYAKDTAENMASWCQTPPQTHLDETLHPQRSLRNRCQRDL